METPTWKVTRPQLKVYGIPRFHRFVFWSFARSPVTKQPAETSKGDTPVEMASARFRGTCPRHLYQTVSFGCVRTLFLNQKNSMISMTHKKNIWGVKQSWDQRSKNIFFKKKSKFNTRLAPNVALKWAVFKIPLSFRWILVGLKGNLYCMGLSLSPIYWVI